MAVAPTTAKQMRRSQGVSNCGAAAAFRGDAASTGAGGCADASVAWAAGSPASLLRESNNANPAASRFKTTATTNVERKPIVGSRKKPAAIVPATAPAVLTQ